MKARWVVSLLAGALAGCQMLVDVDRTQCTDDNTCTVLLGSGYKCGGAGVCEGSAIGLTGASPAAPAAAAPAAGPPPLPERWACLREPARDFVPDNTRRLRVRMDIVDVISFKPPSGLTVKTCLQTDVECMEPVQVGVTPGMDGFLEFDMPYGFEGFLRMEAPRYVTGSAYDTRPFLDNVTTSGPPMLKPDVLQVIAQNSGIAVDPTKGHTILETRDCLDRPGDGAHYEDVDSQVAFYLDPLPSRDLKATTITNQLGAGLEPRAAGGFQNLTPGYKTIVATLAATGEIICSITVPIRAGEVTYARLRPGY